MLVSRNITTRWMTLARRAATLQSRVILLALYFVLWVPLGIVRRLFADPLRRRDAPRWAMRQRSNGDLTSARRQF